MSELGFKYLYNMERSSLWDIIASQVVGCNLLYMQDNHSKSLKSA